MLSLYEILKASKTGIAPDMWTALAGANFGGAGSGAEVKELTGIPPLSFTADGTPLIDYLISGNMQQTGTPTPQNPIQPSECGERTGNLFDVSDFTYTIGSSSQNRSLWTGKLPAGTYTVSINQDSALTSSRRNTLVVIINGMPYYESTLENYHNNAGLHRMIFDVNEGDVIAVNYWAHTLSDNCTFSNAMLNSGSEALPYEPYGYKLDISSASTTTPVYLGQVETTRKIKKLVLTGEEDITSTHTDVGLFNIPVTDYLKIVDTTTNVCSHYKASINVNGWSDVTDRTSRFYANPASTTKLLYIRDSSYTTVADFKTYLTQQYANGTPVTVWYVLATETTSIVNEPLMKIGDYADTLSMEQAGVSIPTNNGSTTVDVETTLKPSEIYIKYKGV